MWQVMHFSSITACSAGNCATSALTFACQTGSLAEFGVSDLFWILSFQKRTGVLRLTDGKEKIDIYLLKGELTDVQWLTRPDEKKLAL